MADLQRSVIPIGYVDENRHTQVRIDCKKMFDDYPNALVSLAVIPPKGDPYPGVIIRDEDCAVWDITASDAQQYGDQGLIQLTFTSGEVVAKSPIGRFRVDESIIPSGDVPTPIANWLIEANAALSAIEAMGREF